MYVDEMQTHGVAMIGETDL